MHKWQLSSLIPLLLLVIPGAVQNEEVETLLVARTTDLVDDVLLQRLNVEVNITEGGDLLVVEDHVYSLNKELSQLERVFYIGRRGNNDQIENIRLSSEGVTFRPADVLSPAYSEVNSYYTDSRNENEMKLWWRFPPRIGLHSFHFTYTVKRALRLNLDGEKGDELRWTVVAARKNYKVANVSVQFLLPEEYTVVKEDQQHLAHLLVDGEKEMNLLVAENEKRFWFRYEGPLERTQQLVVYAQMISWIQHVAEDLPLWQQKEETSQWISSVLLAFAAVLPFVPLLCLLCYYHEPRTSESPPRVTHLPDNLTVALVGALVHDRPSTPEVVATLVDLAVKGYIRIQEQQNEFMILKTNKVFQSEVGPHEKFLLAALFAKQQKKSLTAYRQEISTKLDKMHKRIYDRLVEDTFLKVNPVDLHAGHIRISVLLLASAVLLFLWKQLYMGESITTIPHICLSLVLTSALTHYSMQFASAKTKLGLSVEMNWNGFHQYLLDISNPSSDNSQVNAVFEEYLPFAIVFGLESQWLTAWEKQGTLSNQRKNVVWFVLDETKDHHEPFRQTFLRFLQVARSVFQQKR